MGEIGKRKKKEIARSISNELFLGTRDRKILEISQQYEGQALDSASVATLDDAIDIIAGLAEGAAEASIIVADETDWDVVPLTLQAAIDELAARVRALEPE